MNTLDVEQTHIYFQRGLIWIDCRRTFQFISWKIHVDAQHPECNTYNIIPSLTHSSKAQNYSNGAMGTSSFYDFDGCWSESRAFYYFELIFGELLNDFQRKDKHFTSFARVLSRYISFIFFSEIVWKQFVFNKMMIKNNILFLIGL